MAGGLNWLHEAEMVEFSTVDICDRIVPAFQGLLFIRSLFVAVGRSHLNACPLHCETGFFRYLITDHVCHCSALVSGESGWFDGREKNKKLRNSAVGFEPL